MQKHIIFLASVGWMLAGVTAGYGGASFDNVQNEALSEVSVQGTVVLNDYFDDGDPAGPTPVAVRVVLRQNGQVVKVANTILDTNGQFTVAGVAPGIYNVAVRAYAHLQKTLANVTIDPYNTDLGTFDLTAGDTDGDNEITTSDLATVLTQLTAIVPVTGEVSVTDYASFAAAIDAIGSTSVNLLIPTPQDVTASKTVPANITLRFTQGGSLNLANGVTVTINGQIEAGIYQIFSWTGTGKVVFGKSPSKVFPEWWYAGDYAAAINAAIASVKDLQGSKIVFTRSATLASPINATNLAGMTFEGQGFPSGVAGAGNEPVLVASHSGVVFDCTGSEYLTFRDFSIGGLHGARPVVGFLLARNSTGGAAGNHRFFNVSTPFYTWFSRAVVYSYGSEANDYYSCSFANARDSANAKVMVFTRNNIFSVASSFQTIATGPQSNSTVNIFGGEFYNISSIASDVFYLEGVNNLQVYGAFYVCFNGNYETSGRAYYYVDTLYSSSDNIVIDGVREEVARYGPAYSIYFGNTPRVCTNWVVKNSAFSPKDATGYVLYAHNNVTLHNLTFKNIDIATPPNNVCAGISVNDIEYPDINFIGTCTVRGSQYHGTIAATSLSNHSFPWGLTLDLSAGNLKTDYGYLHFPGAPPAVNFTQANLTTDGAWHLLDLSSIVPFGAKYVLLRVKLQDDAAGSFIQFRQGAASPNEAISELYTQAPNIPNSADMLVDFQSGASERTIGYLTTNTTFTTINITVKGWSF